MKYNPNREEWLQYNVTYTSKLFGESTEVVEAQNKTFARKIFNGQHNPDCKIIKITEKNKKTIYKQQKNLI